MRRSKVWGVFKREGFHRATELSEMISVLGIRHESGFSCHGQAPKRRCPMGTTPPILRLQARQISLKVSETRSHPLGRLGRTKKTFESRNWLMGEIRNRGWWSGNRSQSPLPAFALRSWLRITSTSPPRSRPQQTSYHHNTLFPSPVFDTFRVAIYLSKTSSAHKAAFVQVRALFPCLSSILRLVVATCLPHIVAYASTKARINASHDSYPIAYIRP